MKTNNKQQTTDSILKPRHYAQVVKKNKQKSKETKKLAITIQLNTY